MGVGVGVKLVSCTVFHSKKRKKQPKKETKKKERKNVKKKERTKERFDSEVIFKPKI